MVEIDVNALLPQAVDVAKQAGQLLKHFSQDRADLEVKHKSDQTPQTAADLQSQAIINAGLSALEPQLPILAEESGIPEFTERQQWTDYWLVDPLDGTRGFIDRSKEFTVNIALIHNHQPILGVLLVPKLDICYYAAKGCGAFKASIDALAQPITVSPLNWQKPRIIMGRYHVSARLQQVLSLFPAYELVRCNSAYKIGLVAEGVADIYCRLGPTSEWDTAAGQCILAEAGGTIVDFNGEVLRCNTKASVRNPEFVALGDQSATERLIKLIQPLRRKS